MRHYVLMRLLWAVPTVLAIVVINFLIMHLAPGDPLLALVGEYPAPPGYIAEMRHAFGLDQSLWAQLWLYFVNMAHGRPGFSFASRQDVLTLILGRARYTMMLMLPALAIAAVLGVAAALAGSRRAGGGVDTGITVLSLFGHSVPIFWLGQIFIVVFAVGLRLLPAQGMTSLRAAPTGFGAVLDVLWRHVLPNALIPVVTVIGYNFGTSLTGAILVETVLAWPGLGNLFITSIANRDYPVLQGILLLTGIAVVLANLATDLLYAVIDPRERPSKSAKANPSASSANPAPANRRWRARGSACCPDEWRASRAGASASPAATSRRPAKPSGRGCAAIPLPWCSRTRSPFSIR